MRVFAAVADRWALTEAQRRAVLGRPGTAAYRRWRAVAAAGRRLSLPDATLARISVVLGAHRALATLYGDGETVREWLRGPHRGRPFDGRAPLELLTDAGGLDGPVRVLRFLQAMAAGGTVEPNDVDRDFEPYGADELVFLDRDQETARANGSGQRAGTRRICGVGIRPSPAPEPSVPPSIEILHDRHDILAPEEDQDPA